MLYNALSDVHVVDLTHYLAGPYATKLLTDLGGDVVKIERPGGEGGRSFGVGLDGSAHRSAELPARHSGALFAYLNANKLGVTLNLKHPRGVELLRRLLKTADLLVENFSPGTMARLGLLPSELVAEFPQLSVVSISNFGQDGPDRNTLLEDIVLYARGGWTYAIGERDREPLTPPGSLAQYVGGLYAAVGAMQALFARDSIERGQVVDVSLLEATVASMIYDTVAFQYTGVLRQRMGRQFAVVTPLLLTLPCRDGYIGLHCATDEQFGALAGFIGSPQMASDPRFKNVLQRIANKDALQKPVEEFLARHDAAYLYAEGQRRGVPMARIPNVAEVMEWEQLKARRYFEEIEHPVMGKLRVPGAPIRLTSHQPRASRPAPTPGQHNREVLCGRLGLSDAQLGELAAAGIV